MNKFRIIDLLNRIAKDEGVPIKIKFKGKQYEWSQEFYDYRCIDINHKYLVEDLETEDLNRTYEEIPIIEDKKIEKINLKGYTSCLGTDEEWTTSEEIIIAKINEIIDYLNKEE